MSTWNYDGAEPAAGVTYGEASEAAVIVGGAIEALSDALDDQRAGRGDPLAVIEGVADDLHRAREVLNLVTGDLDPDRSTYDDEPAPYLRIGADEAPKVTTMGEDGSHVEVTFYFGEDDGVPVVQVDTRDGTVRINVNDGELATVHDGGDRIVLPEHWAEYEHPEPEAPRVALGTTVRLVSSPVGDTDTESAVETDEGYPLPVGTLGIVVEPRFRPRVPGGLMVDFGPHGAQYVGPRQVVRHADTDEDEGE